MVSRINSAVMSGLNVTLTEVEVGFSRGIPGTIIVGLPDSAVNESKERIRFAVKNSGPVDGAEIVQVYIQDMESSHPRPVKELKGFEKIPLKAGEEKVVKIVLNSKAFSYWNPDMKNWYAEPGEFKILVGSSSDNILLEQSVILE